jgi:O-acetyl-ADP-ribose deacetylase (regulator of RNase III)
MHIYENGGLVGEPHWIINFPTKGHWRAKSRIEDIEKGLEDLVNLVNTLKIQSIAIPPLGCGNGGLLWSDVRPRIETAFSKLDANVLVYSPEGAPEVKAMINRTRKPNMTLGRAALIYLMDHYLKGFLDPFISLLEVHKLMYFLQESGEHLRLKYVKGHYGPYAENLGNVLTDLEHHYISGYGDGGDQPEKPLGLIAGAFEEASAFLSGKEPIRDRIHEVTSLIEGYEDSYGMELLSSVHWVMRDFKEARMNRSLAINRVHDWSSRKKKFFKAEHLEKAWDRLCETGWNNRFSSVPS